MKSNRSQAAPAGPKKMDRSGNPFRNDNPPTLATVVMDLAEQAGLQSLLLCRAATPSLEELEAEFGGDLVQHGRDVMGVRDADHCAAGPALDEAVAEIGSVDLVGGLHLEGRAMASAAL